jgi:hypothetical protein
VLVGCWHSDCCSDSFSDDRQRQQNQPQSQSQSPSDRRHTLIHPHHQLITTAPYPTPIPISTTSSFPPGHTVYAEPIYHGPSPLHSHSQQPLPWVSISPGPSLNMRGWKPILGGAFRFFFLVTYYSLKFAEDHPQLTTTPSTSSFANASPSRRALDYSPSPSATPTTAESFTLTSLTPAHAIGDGRNFGGGAEDVDRDPERNRAERIYHPIVRSRSWASRRISRQER